MQFQSIEREKKESNLLRQKCTESALICEFYTGNLCSVSYDTSTFINKTNADKKQK